MFTCSAQAVVGGPAACVDAIRILVDEGTPLLMACGWRSVRFAVGFGLSELQYIDFYV